VREIGNAVRDINDVTSNIAGAVGQQDAATREISANAQSAAQGNETLVANIGSLSDSIGETNKAAGSVLTASSDLTPRRKRCRARSTSSSRICASTARARRRLAHRDRGPLTPARRSGAASIRPVRGAPALTPA